jgi:chorismate lyase/3-hydroxybenzoate synthase
MDSFLSSELTRVGLSAESGPMPPDAWVEPSQILGVMAWSAPRTADSFTAAWMHQPLGEATGAPERWDVWRTENACHSFSEGFVRWRSDGSWVFGTVDVPEIGGVEEATRIAYCDLFRVLRQTGCMHLLRVWNYLPRINEEAGGLERYRRFNAGRQQAFIDMGFDAFEGAPAACALGDASDQLRVRFLAGRQAVLPIDNPRQVPAYRYSARYGPKSPTFSRAALAHLGGGALAFFLSGTASVVGEVTAHPGDIDAQLSETLLNIQVVTNEASRAVNNAPIHDGQLTTTVYLRHAEHRERVREALTGHWGADSQAVRSAVFVQADICRSDLLVEIEGHLFFKPAFDCPAG